VHSRMNAADRARMKELTEIMECNARALELMSAYLIMRPRWVEATDVDAVTACGVTEEQAYVALMTAGVGLDDQDNPADRRLALDYIAPAVRRLDPEEYRNDPYFRTVRVPAAQEGTWSLGMRSYAPYEAFVRNDLRQFDDFRETPQIGFFSEGFSFPAVMENGNEWMTVTPNEVETMREAVKRARGDVAAFGLGLGYFAFMAARKENVRSVTVIERDERVISLFEKHILPQFPQKEKIRIVWEDAFRYAGRGMKHDFAFVDLWHDVSDGTGLYIKMKKLERFSPDTEFSYWIEKSLLSHMRFHLFWKIRDAMEAGDEVSLPGAEEIAGFETVERMMEDSYLRKLAVQIGSIEELRGE